VIAEQNFVYYGVIESSRFETSTHTTTGQRVQYTDVSAQLLLSLKLQPLQDLAQSQNPSGVLTIEPVLAGVCGAASANIDPPRASILRVYEGVNTVVPERLNALAQAAYPGYGFPLYSLLTDAELRVSLPILGGDMNHMFAQTVFYRVMITLIVKGNQERPGPARITLPFDYVSAIFAGSPVVQ
jgi:hypothetical protein